MLNLRIPESKSPIVKKKGLLKLYLTSLFWRSFVFESGGRDHGKGNTFCFIRYQRENGFVVCRLVNRYNTFENEGGGRYSSLRGPSKLDF